MNNDSPRLRLSILGIVAFSLFAALFARLWYLQVMAADESQVAAEANRIRVVAVEAPRGRILDRNGKVIVENRISVQVTVDRSALGELDDDEQVAVLTKVADALARSGIPKTVEQLEERIADQRFSPYVPVPIASDVPEDLKIWIDEHAAELPSVAAQRVAVRHYPYGRLAAHVVGYTGKVTKDELDDASAELKRDKPYTLNDEIGKYGVEKVYEAALRGTPGIQRLEVDADGNPVQVVKDQPPVAGDDIVLNLDIDVQAVAEQALQSGLDRAKGRGCPNCEAKPVGAVGSVVVLDPVNHYPLNNWALQGQYAPGSTLKPFSAVSGLAAGLLTSNRTVYDTGEYEVPGCRGDSCFFSNDRGKAYGTVDLRRSLTVSSDFYYYDLGARFWIDQDNVGGPEGFADRLKQWGFHSDTGVDLSDEKGGRIPSPAWLKDYCEQVTCSDDASAWRTGKNVNMAIGQGEVLVTPLQLASAYATLGNGGTRWVPQVVREIRDGETGEVQRTIEPVEGGKIDLAPDWRQAIVDGLVGVTTQEGGTAVGAFSNFPNAQFPIAAKTGTAQVSGKAPTAVFGAFGPAVDPHFAISVFMEESGYGGGVAAPVARRLFGVLSAFEPLPAAPAGGVVPEITELSPDPGDVRD